MTDKALTTRPTNPEVQRLWAAYKEAKAAERAAVPAEITAYDAYFAAMQAWQKAPDDQKAEAERRARATQAAHFAAYFDLSAAADRCRAAFSAWADASPGLTPEELAAAICDDVQPAGQRVFPTPPIRPASQKVSLPQKVSPPLPQGDHLVRPVKGDKTKTLRLILSLPFWALCVILGLLSVYYFVVAVAAFLLPLGYNPVNILIWSAIVGAGSSALGYLAILIKGE
jgi:hypothetical protein